MMIFGKWVMYHLIFGKYISSTAWKVSHILCTCQCEFPGTHPPPREQPRGFWEGLFDSHRGIWQPNADPLRGILVLRMYLYYIILYTLMLNKIHTYIHTSLPKTYSTLSLKDRMLLYAIYTWYMWAEAFGAHWLAI